MAQSIHQTVRSPPSSPRPASGSPYSSKFSVFIEIQAGTMPVSSAFLCFFPQNQGPHCPDRSLYQFAQFTPPAILRHNPCSRFSLTRIPPNDPAFLFQDIPPIHPDRSDHADQLLMHPGLRTTSDSQLYRRRFFSATSGHDRRRWQNHMGTSHRPAA